MGVPSSETCFVTIQRSDTWTIGCFHRECRTRIFMSPMTFRRHASWIIMRDTPSRQTTKDKRHHSSAALWLGIFHLLRLPVHLTQASSATRSGTSAEAEEQDRTFVNR